MFVRDLAGKFGIGEALADDLARGDSEALRIGRGCAVFIVLVIVAPSLFIDAAVLESVQSNETVELPTTARSVLTRDPRAAKILIAIAERFPVVYKRPGLLRRLSERDATSLVTP